MIGVQNIANYDRRGDIESATKDTDGGIATQENWTALYSDVHAREIRAKGTEGYEAGQMTATLRRAWAIRKFDRAVTTEMRFVIDGETFYLLDVHSNPRNRTELIIEGESRDND